MDLVVGQNASLYVDQEVHFLSQQLAGLMIGQEVELVQQQIIAQDNVQHGQHIMQQCSLPVVRGGGVYAWQE